MIAETLQRMSGAIEVIPIPKGRQVLQFGIKVRHS